MKTHFLFSTIFVATLLLSCSSDDNEEETSTVQSDITVALANGETFFYDIVDDDLNVIQEFGEIFVIGNDLPLGERVIDRFELGLGRLFNVQGEVTINDQPFAGAIRIDNVDWILTDFSFDATVNHVANVNICELNIEGRYSFDLELPDGTESLNITLDGGVDRLQNDSDFPECN